MQSTHQKGRINSKRAYAGMIGMYLIGISTGLLLYPRVPYPGLIFLGLLFAGMLTFFVVSALPR